MGMYRKIAEINVWNCPNTDENSTNNCVECEFCSQINVPSFDMDGDKDVYCTYEEC